MEQVNLRIELDRYRQREASFAASEATIWALQHHIAVIESSTFWQITRYARAFLRRAPWLARLLRLSAKASWWTVSGQLPRRLRLYRLNRQALAAQIQPGTEAPAPETELLPSKQQDLPPIHFPRHAAPVLSIIIPTYGQVPVTLRCLRSIFENPPSCPYEIIVSEDASGDLAVGTLASIDGLVLIDRTENLGFLRNSNAAAAIATGTYLHFLNNDTEVLPGAFDALVERLASDPTVGMTGSMLLFPDGRLQEAGGIVWNDASGWNFGRGDDPNRALYTWPHDVDYISGASILISQALFKDLGGFDDIFAPAYYEDTDLAFRIRQAGYRVVFEPASRVIHHEGVSHGTDETAGVKAFQVRNKAIMLERWGDILRADHYPSGTHLLRAQARARRKTTILIIDHYVPEPDRDAGSRATMCVIRALCDAGWLVKFWPQNRGRTAYSEPLEQMGVEIIDYTRHMDFAAWMKEFGDDLDHLMVMRPNVAADFMPYLESSTKPFLSLYGHDIHFLRMMREVELTGNGDLRVAAEAMRKLETRLWRRFDSIIYLSDVEKRLVREMVPCAPSHSMVPYCFKTFLNKRSPAAGTTILFVGGFGHPPNEDAAAWLVKDILPLVRAEIPEVTLTLAGSKPTQKVRDLADDVVTVTGYVTDEELTGLYAKARVAAVPLRFGAGVKGKVVEALYNGLPLVTTSIGAEGIPGITEVCSIEDQTAGFAQALLALLRDDALWQERSDSGRALIEAEFSQQRLTETLFAALGHSPASE